VTIGVAAFNIEYYLRGAFDGILAQDFADFEVVVCDNGSTDNTWAICEEYAAKDQRWRIHRNPTNLGLSGNFRRIVELAQGEYFRWTAHDDRMAPTTLSRCVAALDAHPEAVLAYPRGRVIDEDGAVLFECPGEPDIHGRTASRRVVEAMDALTFCNAMFGVMRLDVLRRTRLLGKLSASDNTLLLELAARGGFHLVDERLFARRTNREAPVAGEKVQRERYEWLEPDLVKQRKKKADNDWLRLTTETWRALAFNEMPLGQRVSATTAFSVVWPTRFARVAAGRWVRRLRGRTHDTRLLAAEAATAEEAKQQAEQQRAARQSAAAR
jgi:glycosyltransferase involved in cell wall biosynthesis